VDEVGEETPRTTTKGERRLWAGLVNVVLGAVIYVVWLLPELGRTPTAEISWVGPLFWSSLAGLVAQVITTVALNVLAGFRGRDDDEAEVTVDVRDREIGWRGGRVATPILAAGLGSVLVLAAAGADAFWIGNAAVLGLLTAAIAEAVLKLRLYRRGF
jgi:hypothetical protein